MRRIHNLSAAYTTSFLDLCCCALGGMILLLVLLIPAPRTEPVEVPTRMVKLRARLPVLMENGRPAKEWPASLGGPARLLFAAQSAEVTVFSGASRRTELAVSALEVGRLIAMNEPLVRETALGTVSVSARRTPRVLGFAFTPAPKDVANPTHAVLDLTAEISVAEDSSDWPLLVGMRVTVTTPPQRVPVGLPSFLSQVGQKWDDLKLAVPAAKEDDLPADDILVSATIEPKTQLSEARAVFPRFGVRPNGDLLLALSGWTGTVEQLRQATQMSGLTIAGTGPFTLTGGGAAPVAPVRVTLSAVAHVSLTPDARGLTIAQIDRFTLSPE